MADQRARSSTGVPPDSLYGYGGGQLLLRLYFLPGALRVGALAPVFLSSKLPTFPIIPIFHLDLVVLEIVRRHIGWERLLFPSEFYVPLGS